MAAEFERKGECGFVVEGSEVAGDYSVGEKVCCRGEVVAVCEVA